MSDSNSNSDPAPRSGIRFTVRWFVLAVLLLALVPYFLPDYLGQPLAVLGTAVWLFTFALFFLFGVAYYALFILPPDIDNWYEEGIRLTLQNYFAGKVDEDPNLNNPLLPPSMRIMRAGVIESHLVLALGRGPLFSRAVGPGYVKLQQGERIRQIIDLRTHRREIRLEAMTRDGIPLRLTLRVDFHIRRQAQPSHYFAGSDDSNNPAPVPFPYEEEAIFAACAYSSFGEGEQEISWTERIARLAASVAVTEISSYTLDEAYQYDSSHNERLRPLDLGRLQRLLRHTLNDRLATHGIEVADVVLSDLALPTNVLEQRITNWQRKWEKRAQTVLHQQEADTTELMRQMQALANVELVQQIMQNMEQIGGQPDEWLDVVTLVSMDALEDAATDVSGELPSQTWETIAELQVLAAQPRLLGAGSQFSEIPTIIQLVPPEVEP